nr:hypothetical protein [Tanacetum cinerariifolium]
MILESVQNGPLIWPTIKENGVNRPRKYSELTPAEAIQADCDVKATNIILQGLPPEVYALVHNPDNIGNNMINQSVQVMPSSEQSNVVSHSETEITSDSNIIPYSHPSSTPTRVKVLQELPKVSMVNTSLKQLKHHLAGFDVVIKERTMATAIIEGWWGFEHTKACFRDEIIPFVKALKDIFNTFDQYLIDELTEVQNDFFKWNKL